MSLELVHNFWNNNPCNVRHSSKEKGTKEYFDEVEKKKYKVEPHILEFADFSKWKGKRVLEIGCGIGTAAVGFARAGAIYTGIDLTENAIELAKQRFENEGLKGRFFVINAEEHLPDAESINNDFVSNNIIEKYDLVYSFGVIHHTPNPSKIITNIHKVISKDGELRIMLYSKWSYKLFWILKHYNDTVWDFSDKMKNTIMKYSEAQTGCPVTFTYTFDEVDKLVSPFFSVTKIWKDHIFPYEIESYKRGEYVIVPEFKNMCENDFKSMCRELGWHTMIIAKVL